MTGFFIRRPTIALLATSGLCLLLWWGGLGFEAREGIDSVLDARGGHREVYERAEEVGAVERTLLVDVEHADLFSPEGLALVWELTEAFLDLETVASAKSLTHSVIPARRGFSFEFEPLVPSAPWSREDLAELKRFCLEHPLIRNVMVSAEGNRTVIAMEYEADAFARATARELRKEAREVLNAFEREGVKLRMTAIPFAELEIREAVKADFLLFAGGSLLLAAAVLRIAFLAWRLAAGVLGAHLVYLSLLPGLFQVMGYRPEPFAIAVFPLLGAVQLALLAHLGTAYMRALQAGRNREHALEDAVAETGKSCLFAALTTAVGLLALTVSETESVRQLGLWGAAGVGAGFLFSFGPALSMLRIIGRAGKHGDLAASRERIRERWRIPATRLAQFSRRRARPLLIGAAAFAGTTVPGVLLLEPDVRIESFLPRGSEAETIALVADREYGGLHFARIDFDSGRAAGISRREFLESLWEVHRLAEEIPEVTAAYSYPQVLTVLNQVWQGDRGGEFKLPEEDFLLGMFSAGLRAYDLPLLGALTDESRRSAFLILRMPSISSERYLEIVKMVTAAAVERVPEGVSIEAGGMVREFLETDREVVRAQILSGIVVLAAVTLLLLVLWWSPPLVLAGVVVTVFPVASVLGIAGFFGMTLNAVTVMAGAIAVGVAVDDAVHFITCWREVERRSENAEVALAETLFLKGPPILFTSIILTGAFLLLSLSSFGPVGQLGVLVAGALALTLPAVLVLLPVLLPGIRRGTSGAGRGKANEPEPVDAARRDTFSQRAK